MAAKTNPKRMLLASVSRPGRDSLAITLAFLVIAATLAGLSSRAEGLRSIVPGAYGLDRAGGRFAQIEDSSANWHNPANLIYLTNAEFQLAPSVVRIEVDHTSPAGSETETQNPWKLAPSAYGAMSFNDGKYALGLGMTMPYGLSVDWASQSPLNTPFYYTAPFFSQLTTVNVNPNVAMRITDNLSVAVGLDVMWSQLEIKQNYSWAPFGATPLVDDGVAELNGDGLGFGGNAALTWEFIPGQRLSLTYRSRMEVNYDGEFQVSQFQPVAGFIGATPNSGFNTKINYPTIIGAGYGIKVSDRVRLELNAEFLEWSQFQSLDLDAGNNNVLLSGTPSPASVPEDWNNTFTAGIAGDWRMTEHFTLRAGYLFYESPIPDNTYSPTIPDANQHVFTIGVAWAVAHHRLELAYGFDLYAKREITSNMNPDFNGTYQMSVNLFSLAYSYHF